MGLLEEWCLGAAESDKSGEYVVEAASRIVPATRGTDIIHEEIDGVVVAKCLLFVCAHRDILDTQVYRMCLGAQVDDIKPQVQQAHGGRLQVL